MTHRIRLFRLLALMRKEFFQIVRDPSTFLIAVLLPMLLLFIYGYGVSLDFKLLPLGLVMEDTAPDAQSFADALSNSRYFSLTVSSNRQEIEQKVIEGSLEGFVVIPSYFSAFREQSAQIAPIQVIADGTNPNTASFVQNYVNAAMQNWLEEQVLDSGWRGLPLIRPEMRYWFNESLDSRNFLLPGSLAITMTLIGTLLTSLVVSREWERGTIEAMWVTSIRPIEFILAKQLSYFFLGMLSFILSSLFTVFFFQVPCRGSLPALLLMTSVFLFAALGLGLFISTIARNQFTASQAALNVGFLPAYMLSGFLFEISSMPVPLQLLSYAMPARYFVSSLQTLFLAGNVWPLILKDFIIIFGIALIFYAGTVKKTVKRLE